MGNISFLTMDPTRIKILYPLQQEFEFARARLRSCVGLELCLTEQVILRRIVAVALDNLTKIVEGGSVRIFSPAHEAAVRFLFQEYGLSWQDQELYEPLEGGYYSEEAAIALQVLQKERYLL
ncbi:MAG TPA: hypothetical protein VJI15_06315 [Candidatus Nanoarchaeia archaeon]|nr:hypothetical protein [Candidatus Nanoarchaeia archaeon]